MKILENSTFAPADEVITEGSNKRELFFIHSGKVSVIYKKSNSFIRDLSTLDSFGEIGFFSGLNR